MWGLKTVTFESELHSIATVSTLNKSTSSEEEYLIVTLDEACRRQQLGEGWFQTLDDVPRRAISMSVRQILKSKKILCIVPDARKAKAVKSCFQGEISPLNPASILRTHPDTTVFLDQHSAALLDSEALNPAS